MHSVFVTVDTSRLRHKLVATLDANRLWVILQSKRERMKKPVVRFGYPFADKVMRQMAIVANRYVMVAAHLPGVHVILHGVTIGTSFRVATQIACPFSIPKRERSQSRDDAN